MDGHYTVIGVNGFSDWFHDPAACVIRDGKLLHFVEEERLSRRKHAPGEWPIRSVHSVLQQSGLRWSDIDEIALGWDIPAYGALLASPMSAEEFAVTLIRGIGAEGNLAPQQVKFVRHHEAHAWSVACLCGSLQTLCIVADGQGEHSSTSVFRYKDGVLTRIAEYDARYSLGYLYEGASWFLGLGLRGTGKLMGLAAYDNASGPCTFETDEAAPYSTPVPEACVASMDEHLDHSRSVVNGFWIPYFAERYPRLRWNGSLPTEVSFAERSSLVSSPDAVALAGFAQRSVESAVTATVRAFLSEHDNAIALCGGVALNCKMNGRIAKTFPDRRILVQPASHDAGVALGAAVAASRLDGCFPVNLGQFPYVGDEYSDTEIASCLRRRGIAYETTDSVASLAARLIASGKVIGWFQGAAEVGPRALGARSILARADCPLLRDRINAEVKGREPWRPLSPVILARQAEYLFGSPDFVSPYMLLAASPASHAVECLAGTTHIDGSSRPQTIAPRDPVPQRFRELLECLYKDHSMFSVLNTSFNRAGEPIVYSPDDALTTFMAVRLDALIIGNCVITRDDTL
jgi:carbamoyltransferase